MDDSLEARTLRLKQTRERLEAELRAADEEEAALKELEQREIDKANTELRNRYSNLQHALKESLQREADDMRESLEDFDAELVKAKERLRLEHVDRMKKSKALLKAKREELESDLLETTNLMKERGIESEAPTFDAGHISGSSSEPRDDYFTLTATAARVEKSPQETSTQHLQDRPEPHLISDNAQAPDVAPQRRGSELLGSHPSDVSAETPEATPIPESEDGTEADEPADTFLGQYPTVVPYRGGYRELWCPVASCRRNHSKKGWFKGLKGLKMHIQKEHGPVRYTEQQCSAHIFDAADCEKLSRGESPVSRVPVPRYDPKSDEDVTWMSGPPGAIEVATASASGAPPTAVPKDPAQVSEGPTSLATTAAGAKARTPPARTAPVSKASDATSATKTPAVRPIAEKSAIEAPAAKTASSDQHQFHSVVIPTSPPKEDGEISDDGEPTKLLDANRSSHSQQPGTCPVPPAVMHPSHRSSPGVPPTALVSQRASLSRTPDAATPQRPSSMARANLNDPRVRADERRSGNVDGPSGRPSSARQHTRQSSGPQACSRSPPGRPEATFRQDPVYGRRDSTIPGGPGGHCRNDRSNDELEGRRDSYQRRGDSHQPSRRNQYIARGWYNDRDARSQPLRGDQPWNNY